MSDSTEPKKVKRTRKYPAPKDWKVGDTIYIKHDSGVWWYEKVIVAQTPRSWLILHPGYSPYQADPNHWRFPEHCEKLPKCGYSVDRWDHDDQWQYGTKQTLLVATWATKHRSQIADAVRYQTEKLDAYRLLNLAKDLGLDAIVADYPEDNNVKEAGTSQSPAVEVADGH